MRWRSVGASKRAKVQRPKTAARKSRAPPKAASRRNLSAAAEETTVARLTRQLNEAYQEQTATAEVLKVISGSPGELRPVFDTMLQKAVRICDTASIAD